MKLQQICRELFQQNGQIGYYLLGCRLDSAKLSLLEKSLEQKEEVTAGGTVSASERPDSAR